MDCDEQFDFRERIRLEVVADSVKAALKDVKPALCKFEKNYLGLVT
jgi:hypothetical protein